MSSSRITPKQKTTDFLVEIDPPRTSGERYSPSFLLFLLTIFAPNLTINLSRCFNIKVVKVYIVGIVAVVDSIFGFSLNSFDDFDHDKCHMNISFFIISMFDLHKLSQGHLGFVQRSFFFFMAVARWRTPHLFDFLLTQNTLRADVTFLFGWSVVSSSRASCSWSWAFDIFWFTYSWFIPRFEGGWSHFVGGFQFFSSNLQLNFQILDFISKSPDFIDWGLIFVSIFIKISFHILDFLFKFNFDIDKFCLFG